MSEPQRQTWALAALVLLVHAGLLAWAHGRLERSRPPESPVITGALVSPTPLVETPPQPLPMAQHPTPQPRQPSRQPSRSPAPSREPRIRPATSRPQAAQRTPAPVVQTSVAAEPAPWTAPPAGVAETPSSTTPLPAQSGEPPVTASPATASPSTSAPTPAPLPAKALASVTLPRSDAAHLNNPPPAYPPVSRRLGETGQVLLEVHIQPDGSVSELRLKRSSGFERLDHAAMKAVRSWRYLPARRGDQPIAWWYLQPIVFSLDS